MAEDPEMIRAQMEQTRASLTEKLEALEHQVVGTVQEATSAVADTVETIKEAAQETVGTVKETVQETVETVRETFDVKLQVRRRPWFMLGGSVLLGYMAGNLLERSRRAPRRSAELPASRGLASLAPEPAAPPSRDRLLHKLGEALQPELDKLKGLAIGALVGALRDVTTTALGEEFGEQVRETFDNVTERLGGQPFKHRILPETDEESCSPGYAPPRARSGHALLMSSSAKRRRLLRSGLVLAGIELERSLLRLRYGSCRVESRSSRQPRVGRTRRRRVESVRWLNSASSRTARRRGGCWPGIWPDTPAGRTWLFLPCRAAGCRSQSRWPERSALPSMSSWCASSACPARRSWPWAPSPPAASRS